jgi:hypothetical protein
MYAGSDAFPTSPDTHDYDVLVAQIHSHGGESDTGGSNSDLDTGAGVQDGCINFVCTEIEMARNGDILVRVRLIETIDLFLKGKLL